ncbi:RNA-guided endonuclease TnpB family protein [Pantanalinema sp. GBBB05]|uniref:RNA-guided endonuclease TnpB family protein n=1 Tax=Pantanalinema sp. GBBB05 TaxID=2604139 RepID=UPI001DA627CB|nr:transposase [Pantanalinema sp. GBBB05]
MKTLEFKLYLSKQQQATIDRWLVDLKWIWNAGLSLLEEDQQRRWRNKNGVDPMDGAEKWQFYCNPDRWDWQPEDSKSKFAGVYGLACSCTHYDKASQQHYPACQIRNHMQVEEPFKLVSKIQTDKANPNKPWIRAICSRVRNGVIESLKEAWKRYLDPSNPVRRPNYKGKRDKLASLTNRNGKTTCLVTGANHIRLPILGVLKVKGIQARLHDRQFETVRIVKRASAYYLQLLVHEELKLDAPKYSDDAIGLDPGVVNALTRSDGWVAANLRHYRKSERKLAKLNRQASRRKLGSKNWQKTIQQIGKLHEHTAMNRKHRNHKLSTYLVQTFGGIALEENILRNMTRRPKPKPREDGKGYLPNQATAKAGLNMALLDVGVYQLRTFIETKSKVTGTEFHSIASHYNSQACVKCGTVDRENRLTQSKFCCTACGHQENADVNAAQVVLNKAPWTRQFRFRLREPGEQTSSWKGTVLPSRNRQSHLTKPAAESFVGCQQELACAVARSTQVGIPEITGKSLSKQSSRKSSSRAVHSNSKMPIQLTLWSIEH